MSAKHTKDASVPKREKFYAAERRGVAGRMPAFQSVDLNREIRNEF